MFRQLYSDLPEFDENFMNGFENFNNKKFIEAIDKGSDHDGLDILYEILDTRRTPALPFLNRDNPLDIAPGKVSFMLKNNSFRSCDEYLWSHMN